MSATQQSNYDYNQVMEFIQNEYNNALSTLQEDLKNLRLAVEACEDLYHGTAAGGLKSAYSAIYNNIGKSNAADGIDISGNGSWKPVNSLAAAGNILYTMAYADKETDENGGNAMTLR
ncbi:MAG: hypothetical protein OSJ70_02935 [Bacilli bacterium]|nr:hypothetical protein [Bacilli bacterium]